MPAGAAVGVKVINGFYNSSMGYQSGSASVALNNANITAVNTGAKGKAIGIETSYFDTDSQGVYLTVEGNLTVNAKAANASGVEVKDATIAKIGMETSVINIKAMSTKENGKAYSLYANNGGDLNVKGKEVILVGDVISDNSTINISGASVDLEGKAITSGNGITNVDFGSGTWNLTGASTITNATFGAGSSLVIDGTQFTGSDYAITGTGKLAVEKGANLIIEGMEKNTYNIAKGFATNEGENFTVVNDNALMQAQMVLNKDAQELKAVVTAKSADQIVSSGIASSSAANTIGQLASDLASAKGDVIKIAPENQAAAKFLMNVMSGAASGNKTAQNMKDAMDSTLNIGENLGANASAAAVANNVTGITTQRLSFTNVSTTPQGGHGKVECKYKSGEGVWAQYMHGKDKVEDMPMSDTTTTYDSQYNGIVFGYDFKEVGKTHTGIAFNYGSGDSNGATSSTHSRSEYDFWGVGLYHSIMNDDTNLVFDINYNKSDTDVTQNGLGGLVTANPKTDTISVGVKAEKLIQNGPVQIVPYAGLRYMTINTDDYRVAALNATYSPERQNVWLIPVGVSLRQENVYENGWKVTPKADLSYIWALGDTDSSMSVAVGNVAPFTNEYTVMDNGSFLGTLGIEAAKGDWTYGLSYSYQKGEYQRSDKWFVDVRYSF